MSDINIQNMLDEAISVAKKAGLRLKDISQRTINSDEGYDIKLQEDVESEKFIRENLAKTGIPVIGEELSGNLSLIENEDYYWIVDPIDGTYNYLRDYPGVCVSIALMKGMKSLVGVIYDFTRDELFASSKDTKLTLNGEIIEPKWAKSINQAMLMTGFPNTTNFEDESLKNFLNRVKNFKKVRMCGSAALAIAYVACGRADAYFEDKIYLWDIAAGLCLVESALGKISVKNSNIEGKPLCLNVRAVACEEFILD